MTIKYYRQQGFNIRGAKKFQDSRLQDTKKVKRFRKIVCSSNCTNTIAELKDFTYAVDKNGEIIEYEFNIDPHRCFICSSSNKSGIFYTSTATGCGGNYRRTISAKKRQIYLSL